MTIEPKKSWPKSLGALVDRLYKLRQETTELNRQLSKSPLAKKAEKLKAEAAALEDYLIEVVTKDDLEGASGKVAKAAITKKEYPSVTDWEKVQAYIKKKAAWDLLPRSLSTPACRERWAERVVIPGVTKFTKTSLSVTKR